jgi:hypothetical protein
LEYFRGWYLVNARVGFARPLERVGVIGEGLVVGDGEGARHDDILSVIIGIR